MNNTSEIHYEDLDKLDKIAYLFVILGPEISAPILNRLSEENVKKICLKMTSIHIVPSLIRKKILNEFSLLLVKKLSEIRNDTQQVKKLLSLVQGNNKADSTWKELFKDPICVEITKLFEKIELVKIYDALKAEQNQTIATLLTCIPSKKATQFLALFPKERQEEILLNMGMMQPIPKSRLYGSVKMLSSLYEKKDDETPDFIDGGPASVANVLNAFSKDFKKTFIEDLGKQNKDLLKTIEKYLFTFEDLLKLKKEELQRVVREADTNDIVLALKGASSGILEVILKSMSKRAAESLKEELENLGPTKVKDIEAARDRIVAVVRQLEQNGSIVLEGDDDELMV